MKNLITGILTLTFAALGQAQPANPPAPPTPGNAAAAAPADPVGAPLAMDAVIPMADLQLVNMPLEQFLEIYANYVNRTILRAAALPNLNVTLQAQTPLTVVEAIQAMDSVLSLNGYTTIPVGEKFVTFVPSANALQEGAAFSIIDKAADLPEANQYITHIKQLKHILPSEAVPMLTPMAKNAAGIVALDVSKTLVLRDNSSNIKRMLELLERIDIKPEEDYKLKVIPIRYGKVEEIYATMQDLITGSSSPRQSPSGTSRTSGRTSSSQGSTGRTSSSRGSVRSLQNRPSTSSSTPNSFRNRLQGIVNRAAGGDIQILENARIIPDYRSNSLIVFANEEDMVKIDEIVGHVDNLLAQVLIEAIIVNVTLTDGMNTGMNAFMHAAAGPGDTRHIGGFMNGGPSTAGAAPTTTPPANTGGGNQGGQGGQGGAADAGNVVAAAGSALNTLGAGALAGGFSYISRYDNSLEFAISALASNSTAKVLQTPRVQTSHAVPATFFNGEQVPYQGSSGYGGSYGGGYGGYGGGGGYTQFLNVGITLDVTPYITPDDLVVMDIQQTISELDGFIDMGGGQQGAAGQKAPQTTEREASSTISVRDGDTILLGGFIRDAKTDTESGVPFLKDIPLLGSLFKSKSATSKRSELLVLIRPTILKTPEDAALMVSQERMRLPGIREAEAEFKAAEEVRRRKVEKKLSGKSGKAATSKTPARKLQLPTRKSRSKPPF